MIVYHGIDMDGWFSAALLLTFSKGREALGDYMIPADYKDAKQVYEQVVAAINSNKPPTKIIVCDFSFKPAEFTNIINLANSKKIKVFWFDHHISAINDAKTSELVNALPGVRDTSVSAAKLIGDFLNIPEPAKQIIQIVSDYDTFNFDDTKFATAQPALFNAGFNYNIKPAPEMIERAIDCLKNNKIKYFIDIGNYLLTNDEAKVPGYLKNVDFGEFEGKKYALLNMTDRIGAQIAQKLFEKVDFCVFWSVIAGKSAKLFLTSSKKASTDVSLIAKRIAELSGGTGGGHKNASGANLPFSKFYEIFLKD